MTIQWLTRAAIELLPPNRPSAVRNKTFGMFFHHSGTAKPSIPKSVDESIAQWRNIQRDHLSRVIFDIDGNPILDENGQPLKWADIAYNVGIGYRCILDGRTLPMVGGGTGGIWDRVTFSICVLGNMTIEEVTEDQEETILFLLRHVYSTYGELSVNGDRDVNSTNCPGDNVYKNMARWWTLAKETSTPKPNEPEEDEDVGKPLYRVRSDDPYEAWLVRWDNGKLSHLGPAENGSEIYKDLPVFTEMDRESYKRLVEESGTSWRPSK